MLKDVIVESRGVSFPVTAAHFMQDIRIIDYLRERKRLHSVCCQESVAAICGLGLLSRQRFQELIQSAFGMTVMIDPRPINRLVIQQSQTDKR